MPATPLTDADLVSRRVVVRDQDVVYVKGIFEAGTALLSGNWSGLGRALLGITESLARGIGEIFLRVFDTVLALTSRLVSIIPGFGTAVWTATAFTFPKAASPVATAWQHTAPLR